MWSRATGPRDDNSGKYEREAQDFAHALLTDDREAIREGLTCSLEGADYFGVPEEFVRLQVPLVLS